MEKSLFVIIGMLTLGSLSLILSADTPAVNNSFKEIFHKEITENPGINSSRNSREISAFSGMDCSDSEGILAKTDGLEMKGIEITFNSIPVAHPGESLQFYPGLMNVLTVAPFTGTGSSPFHVHVMIVTPKGTELKENSVVSPGETHRFKLGPMLEPPIYSFKRGLVLRKGYSLEIIIKAEGDCEPRFKAYYHQGLKESPENWRHGQEIASGPGLLVTGKTEWILFNPVYGVEQAVGLRLGEEVLRDQDNLVVQSRLNPGASVETIEGMLIIRDAEGETILEVELNLDQSESWISLPVENARKWPPGDYRISFHPVVENATWDDGPSVVYRRRSIDENIVRVSPFSPWTLQSDPDREEIRITDFREIIGDWVDVDSMGRWQLEEAGGKANLTFPEVDPGDGEMLELFTGLKGTYAIFALGFHDGCIISLEDMVGSRWLHTVSGCSTPVFVTAGDLTGSPIRLHPFEVYSLIYQDSKSLKARSGLAELHLVPVTEESVMAFRQETSRPPVKLYAVADWPDVLHYPIRVHDDEFDMLIAAQAELGLIVNNWELGRSDVYYHSRIPGVNRFPSVPLEEADRPNPMIYKGRTLFINKLSCPLRTVLDNRKHTGTEIWPRLMMNSHWGERGGLFGSEFYVSNPRFHLQHKDGSRSRFSFFFEEVRRERVSILLEAAEMGADGIVVDNSRGTPPILYHSEMVEEYRRKTGVDPLKIDAADGKLYEDWIRWRADHFTELLRMLRSGLSEIEERQGRRIPVSVRFPSVGLFYNLAQSFDVKQWLVEGLVDMLQLNPLEECGGRGNHDVAPYVKLGHEYGIPVIGGIGARGRFHTASFYRALSLIEAGVDGIEYYATEQLVRLRLHDKRWLMPIFGAPWRMKEFLGNSNWEACYPLTDSSVMGGYDNSSRWFIDWYNVYGFGRWAL